MSFYKVTNGLVGLCLLAAACGHSKNAKNKNADPDDPRQKRFVIIDARRLPDATVQRATPKKLQTPTATEIAELREQLCNGETENVIFYQLVVSKDWHYYWLCSKPDPVRAMTRRGEKELLSWLKGVESRMKSKRSQCKPDSSKRMFVDPHASGATARAYCDGVLILSFPDGGEKSLELNNESIADRLSPAKTGAGKPATGGGDGPSSCPECKCPAAANAPPGKADSPKKCEEFGQRAFWAGVRKTCDTICPAIFQRCRKANRRGQLCHQLSEFCATLKGVCVK